MCMLQSVLQSRQLVWKFTMHISSVKMWFQMVFYGVWDILQVWHPQLETVAPPPYTQAVPWDKAHANMEVGRPRNKFSLLRIFQKHASTISASASPPPFPTHYSIKLGLELYHHFPIIINGLMHKSQFRLYKAVNFWSTSTLASEIMLWICFNCSTLNEAKPIRHLTWWARR